MAKTLIGNVKGKDGRGITSIEKTGTTGPVDTYTITYTDSTTSTFTVNNSDSIALQRQIVPSAAIESSATASQSYAAGDYVVVNGILRKVKSAIAKGDTIGDSNSTAETVTGELATLEDFVSQAIKLVAHEIWGSSVSFGMKTGQQAIVMCGNEVFVAWLGGSGLVTTGFPSYVRGSVDSGTAKLESDGYYTWSVWM